MGCSRSNQSSEINDENYFRKEEKACIAGSWESIRVNSADSGLCLLQHFFYLYPEEIEKFQFTKDQWGYRYPDYLTSEALRQHSIKVMDALDAVLADMLQGRDIHSRMVDIGYAHLIRGRMEIEPGVIKKFLAGIYGGLKIKLQKKDSDAVMLAWKKLFDLLAEGFEEGLKQARDSGTTRGSTLTFARA